MGRKQAEPSAGALVTAFAAVAVSFVLSTVVSEGSNVKIRADAELITEDAAPSIVHLEAFRSEARHLVVLADDEVDRAIERQHKRSVQVDRLPRPTPQSEAPPAPQPHDADLLGHSLARLDGEWALYRALQTLPHEARLAALVVTMRERFVAELQSALAASRAGDATKALDLLDQRVKPAADALDDAAVKVVEHNAQAANQLATRIDRLGRRSIVRAAILDGLSIGLTILAAFLVVRFMRRYTRLVEQRADELELFAGRVAHDVLSPLSAASLALSYLSEKAIIEDARARRMLALGLRGIEHTRLIADDLLKFASAGARPDPAAHANPHAVIVAVVEETRGMAEERKVTLSIDGVDHGRVHCALGILSSLVSNLVRNGVKYVGEGPGKTVCVRARRLGAIMRIEVEDNGPGLPPAMEAAIFEPYVRGPDNHQPGIGLGLATVKRVVEAHGGRVDVRSVVHVGCRFGIELPCVPDESAGPVDGAGESHDERALSQPD
jgi:signal transduction histidine kinase